MRLAILAALAVLSVWLGIRFRSLPSPWHAIEISGGSQSNPLSTGSEVRFLEMRGVDGEIVPFLWMEYNEAWQLSSTEMTAVSGQEAWLQYRYKSRLDGEIRLLFLSNSRGGKVDVLLDGKPVKEIDLYEAEEGLIQADIEVINPDIPVAMRLMLYGIDILSYFSLGLLALGILRLTGMGIQKAAFHAGKMLGGFAAVVQKAQTGTTWKRFRSLVYLFFSWFLVLGTLLIGKDFFRALINIRAEKFFWYDVALTYGFLGGVAALECLIAAIGLALIASLFPRRSRDLVLDAIKSVTFSLFLGVMGVLAYWSLYNFLPADFRIALQNISWQLFVALGLAGAVISMVFRKNVISWFDETSPRILFAGCCLSIVYLLTTCLLLIEPLLARPASPPVSTSPSQTKMPNILFIFVDTLGARQMSLYGYPLDTTPEMEKIVQQWSVYEKHQVTANSSVYNLPSVITGHFPARLIYHQYGDLAYQGEGWMTLTQVLKQNGYDTVWYGYLTPSYFHFQNEFDQILCEEKNSFSSYLNRTRFLNQSLPNPNDIAYPLIPHFTNVFRTVYGKCDSLSDLLEFLKEKEKDPQGNPFFVYFHYLGVHGPGYPSGNFLGSYLPIEKGLTTPSEQLALFGEYSPEEQENVDNLSLRYAEAIREWDRQMSDFIHEMEKLSLYENTMIVISADHGQNFDSGFSSHNTPLLSHDETHVPLLIKYPNQSSGEVNDFATSSIDLFPTVLDLLGISYPERWLEGSSLLDGDEAASERMVYSESAWSHRYAVTQYPYRLVSREGMTYLYNIEDDPGELLPLDSDQIDSFPALENAFYAYLKRESRLKSGVSILEFQPLP